MVSNQGEIHVHAFLLCQCQINLLTRTGTSPGFLATNKRAESKVHENSVTIRSEPCVTKGEENAR